MASSLGDQEVRKKCATGNVTAIFGKFGGVPKAISLHRRLSSFRIVGPRVEYGGGGTVHSSPTEDHKSILLQQPSLEPTFSDIRFYVLAVCSVIYRLWLARWLSLIAATLMCQRSNDQKTSSLRTTSS